MTMTVKCKAFSGEGVKANKVRISPAGEVSVWDNVAGYYTTCHALSPAAIRRIKKLAR